MLEIIRLKGDTEISVSLKFEGAIICVALTDIDSVGFVEHITGNAQLTIGDVVFSVHAEDVPALVSPLGRERVS